MGFLIVNQNESTTELYHYGIKGQKWGIRRYQDASGRLTKLGRERYGKNLKKYGKRAYKYAQLISEMHRMSDKFLNKELKRKKVNKENIKALENSRKELKLEYDSAIKAAERYANSRIQKKVLNTNMKKMARKFRTTPKLSLPDYFLKDDLSDINKKVKRRAGFNNQIAMMYQNSMQMQIHQNFMNTPMNNFNTFNTGFNQF